MSDLDTVREARMLAEWTHKGYAIACNLESPIELRQQRVAGLCVICGAHVSVGPTTLIARVGLDEPTRPLCSAICNAKFSRFMRGE